MSKKCAKCGRPITTKKCNCDKWVTLAAQPKTVEVHLKLTRGELTVVAETLAREAANLRSTGGGDWKVQAEVLETVARAFRKATWPRTARPKTHTSSGDTLKNRR